MFCSCRISTDKCLARSLCHSRATCNLTMPIHKCNYFYFCCVPARNGKSELSCILPITLTATFQSNLAIGLIAIRRLVTNFSGAGLLRGTGTAGAKTGRVYCARGARLICAPLYNSMPTKLHIDRFSHFATAHWYAQHQQRHITRP